MDTAAKISAEALVSAYINIRDAKYAIQNELNAKIKELDDQLDKVSQALLDLCKDNNLDGFRTEYGTVSQIIKSDYTTDDWESFYKFVKEHDAYNLLHKRINQSEMKSFLEENPDLHPEGMNVIRSYTIRVTRPRGE